MEFKAAKHSFGASAPHLQFTPKKGRKVFMNSFLQKACQARFKEKAMQLRVKMEAMEFGPDHVHLFVSRCGAYSGYELKRQLKGFVSKMMRKNHRPLFVDKLWGKKFWKRGSFCRSIGSTTSEAVRFYIERCQAKHWHVN